MIQVTSNTGDECHYNLHNVSDNRLEKAFKRAQRTGAVLQLCFSPEEQPETLTHERAVVAKQLRAQRGLRGIH